MIQLVDIDRFAPGVAQLSNQEQAALQSFTLLWTLFEAQVLESGASVQKIAETVQGLNPTLLEGGWFQEHLEYFTNRYIENGKTNHRFDHLHLRKNDKPELIRAVLVGEEQEPASQLITCLAIVYRFRNNFFHGIKWAYGIQGQYDNFAHATALLAKCLERFPHRDAAQ